MREFHDSIGNGSEIFGGQTISSILVVGPIDYNVLQTKTTAIVWSRVKEGRKEGRKEDTTKKMLTMQLYGKRRNGRPRKTWLYSITEGMKECNMNEEMDARQTIEVCGT